VDSTVRMDELAEGMAPNSERALGLKVLDRNGDPVLASTIFHSGVHPV
jgi:DNA gyrase subunit A